MIINNLNSKELILAQMERRIKMSTFYTFKEKYLDVYNSIINKSNLTLWGLPTTKLEDEIENYESKIKFNELNMPVPKSVFRNDKDLEGYVIQIKNGINFNELAQSSDLLIKPIVLYYSSTFLASSYSKIFINWQSDKLNHGLSMKINGNDPNEFKIEISDKGFFPRLAASCFLLTGQPNPYIPLCTYSKTPIAYTGIGECLEYFGKKELFKMVKSITIKELVNYSIEDFLLGLRRDYGFHKVSPQLSTLFLNDILLLFASSYFARYNPILWKSICEGMKNDLIVHFSRLFDRYQNDLVNLILFLFENPINGFEHFNKNALVYP